MAIILPDLPYAYDALEPYIDAETMHLHHDKHHQAYVNNANAALEKHPEIGEDLEALLADVESIPADIRQALINNGGGHLNHALFWELMTPEKNSSFSRTCSSNRCNIWFIRRIPSSIYCSSNYSFRFWMGMVGC